MLGPEVQLKLKIKKIFEKCNIKRGFHKYFTSKSAGNKCEQSDEEDDSHFKFLNFFFKIIETKINLNEMRKKIVKKKNLNQKYKMKRM